MQPTARAVGCTLTPRRGDWYSDGYNMQFHPHRVANLLLVLSFLSACGRPPADNASNPADSQKLPFDREPRSTGMSPSQSLIPSTTKLPEGTPIAIRLQSALSSASSRAGDTFGATIDEPVVIDGQTLVASGASATGRVLEAKPAASSRGSSLEPGYLRIVLVSLNIGGRPVMIETSSIFAKAGSREGRNPAADAAFGASQKGKDIVLGIDRHLSFRLAQAVDLQPGLH
ncbi:MAG: hypothetical protein LAO23_14975 [Acidobacteriia bacterium]|nr:hypothetical protein [Terriglobia bacterium]